VGYEAEARARKAKLTRQAIDKLEQTQKGLRAALDGYRSLQLAFVRPDVLVLMENALDLLELDISRAEKSLTETVGD
jgi:hypothetical protein